MVPLRLVWTIMVAAKLDHSRVLVTKFCQNRSTLKGRSAGHRHTHTHVKGVAWSLCGRSGFWTIMVVAKLDQSRVLMTKFHQNRSTLKGRSADQRHTDRQTDRQTDRHTHTHRQTNSAKNKGPSGLQSGQYINVTHAYTQLTG